MFTHGHKLKCMLSCVRIMVGLEGTGEATRKLRKCNWLQFDTKHVTSYWPMKKISSLISKYSRRLVIWHELIFAWSPKTLSYSNGRRYISEQLKYLHLHYLWVLYTQLEVLFALINSSLFSVFFCIRLLFGWVVGRWLRLC